MLSLLKTLSLSSGSRDPHGPDLPSPYGRKFHISLNFTPCLKQEVRPIHGHVWHSFPDLELQANTDYSASLPFSRCPMRLTSNWVTERSSQYLIHLVKFTNIQPRNNNIFKKKTQKKHKKKEKPKL